MDYEKLFRKVFNCNGEDELHKVVSETDIFKNSDNWYPYGGKHKDDRSNPSTFRNQQPSAEGALIEKITNSIDSLLLKRCKQEDIDPKTTQAPSSIQEAVEKFFKIKNGDIGEMLPKERTQFAKENIQVLATGNNKDPDILIYDNGEGQHPNEFKNTFLSIANDNKNKIKFVQGMFNMGSTGAVVFCGEYKYQLIASKMNEKLFSKNNNYSENLFGWTLVRKHNLSEEERERDDLSWYEYFAIDGEVIPSFIINSLDIGLYEDKVFKTGSFVKLYSYKLTKGSSSAIGDPSGGLSKELNQLLYKPALPIWLYEKRKKYNAPTRRTDAFITDTVYGNHARFNSYSDSESSVLEVAPIYQNFKSKDIGEITIGVIILKKGKDRQQQTNFKRNHIGPARSLIFTLNGQVHGKEGQSIITKDLDLHFLKDAMLIVVDCSRLKSEFREDIFMADRSTLRNSEKYSILRKKIIEILKEGNASGVLRKINDDRRNAAIHGGDDNQQKLIHDILSRTPLDKSLAQLLKRGSDPINMLSRFHYIESNKGNQIDAPKETHRFPSIFKINAQKDATGKLFKSIPLNGKGKINFETDVDDDYFYRSDEKGELHLYILGSAPNESEGGDTAGKPKKIEDFFEVTKSDPDNGSIKLMLKPNNKEISVGDEIEICAKLTSPDGDIESIFHVKIADPANPQKSQSQKEPDQPNMPKLIKVSYSEGEWKHENGEMWDEKPDDWDFDSVINILPDAKESEKFVAAIIVNMSSKCLDRYLRKNHSKNENAIHALKNKYITHVYLHSLFLYSILEQQNSKKDNDYSKKDNDSENETNIGDVEKFIADIFEQYGDVLVNLDTNKEIFEIYTDSDD